MKRMGLRTKHEVPEEGVDPTILCLDVSTSKVTSTVVEMEDQGLLLDHMSAYAGVGSAGPRVVLLFRRPETEFVAL